MTTFKQYLAGDVVADSNPFAIREHFSEDLTDAEEWSNGDNTLLLVQKLGSGDGVLNIKVKAGFKVDFKLKSSEDFAFARVASSYDEQEYPDEHIRHSSTGIGGSSSLWFSMWGGDEFDIWKTMDNKTAISMNLRRSASMDSGGWATTDEGLSRYADIKVTLQAVLRYAQATGDYEGADAEESAVVVHDEGDRWGEDDTPIDPDYRPWDDDALVLDPETDFQPSAMVGALMLAGAGVGLSALIKR